MNAFLTFLNLQTDAYAQWSRWYFDAWVGLATSLMRGK
jgi:hypothetical protein